MNTYLIVILHFVLDLDSHADTLVLPGLVIRTSNIVVKFFHCLKVIWLVVGNCKSCSSCKLELSQRYVVIAVRVCYIRLVANCYNQWRRNLRPVPTVSFQTLRRCKELRSIPVIARVIVFTNIWVSSFKVITIACER